MKIGNFLYGKKWFWRARFFLQHNLSFKFFTRVYQGRHFAWRGKNSLRHFRLFLTAFVLYLLYGIVVVILLEMLSSVLPIASSVSIQAEISRQFLATIVTVVGIFLGLYFTAVSAVAGSLFMRATNDLQEQFLRDPKGRDYIRVLGLTIVIGIYYLGLGVLGYEFSIVGLVAIVLLASYAAIRFIVLGFRIFHFIHPVEASAAIVGDAAYAIKGSSVGGFGWRRDYLQNHYRKQAARSLNTLRSLISFCVEAIEVSDEQLVTVAEHSGSLLNYYVDRRKQIPTESHWHASRQQFQDWILANESELALALNTGTALLPKNVKDWNWFEEDCIDTVLSIFDHLIEKKRWKSAHACVEILISIAEIVGGEFYDDTGQLILEKLTPKIKRAVAAIDSSPIPDDRRIQLGFVDSYGRLGIGLLIGLLRHVHEQTPDQLSSAVGSIDWRKASGVYRSQLPGKLLPILEKTALDYRTEILIERRSLSPSWYLRTITTQQYLFKLKAYFEFTKSLHAKLFKKSVEQFIADKKFLCAAGLVERWQEFSYKLERCGDGFQKLAAGCTEFKKVLDLPWVEIDFEKEQELINSYRKEAVNKLTQLLPDLSDKAESEEIPDYFGQAYTFGVEACHQACAEDDPERFEKLFTSVFFGSIAAFERTRRQTDGWAKESQIMFSSEPIEDLLNLSGYAKLYAELHENNALWKVCEAVWDRYLEGNNAKNMLELIAAAVAYRDAQFMLMPKATIRANWDIGFSVKLQKMNLIRDPSEERSFGRRTPGAVHPSPIIRAAGSHGVPMSINARDIFFVTYLSEHSAAQGIDFPDRQQLRQRIERESRRSEHGQNQHE